MVPGAFANYLFDRKCNPNKLQILQYNWCTLDYYKRIEYRTAAPMKHQSLLLRRLNDRNFIVKGV